MNRYRVVVSLVMGDIHDFYINEGSDKDTMLQTLGNAHKVIVFKDADDKIHFYPLDSVNYITID